MKRTVILVLMMSLIACMKAESSRLDGVWQSSPVRLKRDTLDETYVFRVRLQSSEAGVMDVTYWTTGELAGKRLIRQTLQVEVNGSRLALRGGDPQHVSGPDLEGVYAPDDLYCDLPASERLKCSWGSEANEGALSVSLERREQ